MKYSNFIRSLALMLSLALFFSIVWTDSSAGQSNLPDGPGKAELQKLCMQCHELEKSYSLKQDRAGWQRTMDKMTAFGMKSSEEEFNAVLEYLVKHYAAEDVPRVKVNKASAIELESGLSLKRSQAKALLEYREKNGPFKSLDDLKKVPGLDAAKLEERKDRISFEQ
jgi:competence protein ComEA